MTWSVATLRHVPGKTVGIWEHSRPFWSYSDASLWARELVGAGACTLYVVQEAVSS